MGQFLSQPNTDKDSFDDQHEASGLRIGVTSMQGWRSGMEDAHLCNLDFDKERKLFGVFDGHAGPEVAQFLTLHLGEFLLKNKVYISSSKDKKINPKKLGMALTETFMKIDAHLLTDEAIAELEKLSERKPDRGSCDNSEDEQEEARELVSEANMSLTELMAKYGPDAFGGDGEKGGDGEGDGKDSSKHVQARKHLKAMAQKAGYDIAFGDDDEAGEQEEENEDPEKKEDGSADKAADEPSNGVSESSSGGRRRKALKPSKVQAGPVDVTLASDSKAETDDAAPSKAKAAKGDTDAEDDDDADDDESGNEYEGGDGEDDSEDGSEDGEEEDSDDEEEDEEDGRTSGDFDDDFPQGVGKSSGSTAVAALLCGDQLIVANTGDSRCVLCRGGEAVAMSEDHQPELSEERERIERAGGIVSDVGRVNNGLNMSRAIGDHGYKMNEDLPADEQMIIAKPDIRIETIGEADEFMILACDGIWNCMTNEECVKFVRKRLLKRGSTSCLSAICEEVCDHCLAPDISGDGTGSDNMTMMIVQLKKDLAPPAVRRKKSRASAASDGESDNDVAPSPARKRSRHAR